MNNIFFSAENLSNI